MVRNAFGVIAALAFVACGGAVVEEPGGSAGAGSAGADGTLPKSPLPKCELGDSPDAAGAACPFVANGLCYDDKQAACACECRRTHGTVCVSGFPGHRVEVNCP